MVVVVKGEGMGWEVLGLIKELAQWSDEYMHLLGDINKYEELKRSLLLDELSMVYKFFVTYSWINFL